MKHALKTAVVALALALAGMANAANVVVPVDGITVTRGFTALGTGYLEVSKNLASAAKLGNVQYGAFDSATVTPKTVVITDSKGKTSSYQTYVAAAPVTSLTLDDAADNKAVRAASAGGLVLTMDGSPDLSADGGVAQVGNLDIHFNANGSASIYGTMTGKSNNGAVVNFSGLAFEVAASRISGATSFPMAAGTYSTVLKGLAITQPAFDALATVLGLEPGGVGYDSVKAASSDFGTMSSVIVATAAMPAIPEPSSYSLMGLGLAGVGIALRRKRTSAAVRA